MTLMQLGPVSFDMTTNLQDVERAKSARFAKHKVLGAVLPVYEPTGGEEATATLNGVVYPEAIGTNGSVAALGLIRDAQIPTPLFRGDFVPFGWVVIMSVSSKDTKLHATGIGRRVDFTVNVEFVGTPSASLASRIVSFL